MPLSTVSIVVPEGATAGLTVLQVSLGGGRVAQVQVPKGATAGTELQFQVELPATEGESEEEEEEEDGPTYTSGDEDDPAILSPAQFRARHPDPSPHRTRTRAYRTHYYHNQKDGGLHTDVSLAAVLCAPVRPGCEVVRVRYEDVVSAGSFDRFCGGRSSGTGQPVILTDVPRAAETMARFSVKSLRAKNSLVANARVRICKAFQWGKREMDGRLPLKSFFRMLTEHPNADIPFYVFENQIGGGRHTIENYRDVDAWAYSAAADAANTAIEDDDDIVDRTAEFYAVDSDESEGRNQFSLWYEIPSLFTKCLLKVPYLLRPRSTDGVLLIGSRRSGSYPHVDPSYTAAWNWLFDGVKRWCLFPPHIPRHVICGGGGEEDYNDESLSIEAKLTGNGVGYWWQGQYPKLRERAEELGMVEVLQQPGEIIYVPQGWWHAVINVSDWTVAVTHNLVMPQALPDAFAMAAEEDAVFARRWWRCLCKFAPDAARTLRQGRASAAIVAALNVTLPVGEYNGMKNNSTVTRIDEELKDSIQEDAEKVAEKIEGTEFYTAAQLAQASALASSMSQMLCGMPVSSDRCAYVLKSRAAWSDKKAISVLLSQMDAGEDLGAWTLANSRKCKPLDKISSKLLNQIISYLPIRDAATLAVCSATLRSLQWHVPKTLNLRLRGSAEGEGKDFAKFWARMVSIGTSASGCSAIILENAAPAGTLRATSAGCVLRALLGDDMSGIVGLQSINLVECSFGDDDAVWLSNILKHHRASTFREVSIMDCGEGLTDVGFGALVSSLLFSSSDGNCKSDCEGGNSTTELEISFSSSITEKGVVAAFERPTVSGGDDRGGGDGGGVSLNLSGNGAAISDASVRIIAGSLGDRLRALTLFESPLLTDVSLDTLADMCPRLELVNVMYCGCIGQAAVARLRRRLPAGAEVLA